MQPSSDHYFHQTRAGESRWWSWGMGFWFLVLSWLTANLIIPSPAGEMVATLDPELNNAMMNETVALMSGSAAALGLLMLLFVVATALGVLFWLIHRNAKEGTRRVFGILTGICVVLSLFSIFRLIPMMSSPELSRMGSQMIALSPVIYALILLAFPASLVGLYLSQKYLHKRTLLSLHTAAKSIRWGRGLQCFLATWIILGTLTAIGHFTGISRVDANFDSGRFLGYALVSLLLLPLQSGTEEIVFRGYLVQGFSHFLKNKWVVFTITSLMFMAMHLANPEAAAGAEAGTLPLTMSHYFAFGFTACLLVWMDNGLETAIGFHAANNTFAGIFVNYEGSVIPTPSVFMATPNLHVDILFGFLAFAAILGTMYVTRKPLDAAIIPESKSADHFA